MRQPLPPRVRGGAASIQNVGIRTAGSSTKSRDETRSAQNNRTENPKLKPGDESQEAGTDTEIHDVDGAEQRARQRSRGRSRHEAAPPEDVRSVGRHAYGQGGGDSRIHHQQAHPAIEEGSPLAIGFAQIDVQSTVIGIPGGQFPKQSAPLNAISAIKAQTKSSQNGDPRDFAIPAGVRKIPMAMDSPATAAIAEPNPNSRRKPCGFGMSLSLSRN